MVLRRNKATVHYLRPFVFRDHRLHFKFLIFALIFMASLGPVAPFAGASSTGSLQGQVTDHFGAMIPGVIVTVANADTGDYAAETTSDRNGIFLVSGLPPGNYSVRVAAMYPFGETDDRVEVDADRVANVRMVLGRGCSLSGDTGGLQEGYLAETVRLAFRASLDRLAVPHAKGQIVFVSKANIKPDWLASLTDADVKFIPEGSVPPADTSARPAKFVRISEIRTAAGCSSISIGYVSAAGAISPDQRSDDIGFTLEFRKVGEKWLKRTVLEVIS